MGTRIVGQTINLQEKAEAPESKYITEIDAGRGITVHAISVPEYIQIDSNGMKVFVDDTNNAVAQFLSNHVILGRTSAGHSILTPNSFELTEQDGNDYFISHNSLMDEKYTKYHYYDLYNGKLLYEPQEYTHYELDYLEPGDKFVVSLYYYQSYRTSSGGYVITKSRQGIKYFTFTYGTSQTQSVEAWGDDWRNKVNIVFNGTNYITINGFYLGEGSQNTCVCCSYFNRVFLQIPNEKTGPFISYGVINQLGGFGDYSFSSGDNTIANGDYSFSIGERTEVLGDYSFAMGQQNQVMGDHSCAEGYSNYIDILGSYCHVEGASNTAKGNFNHIEGSDSYVEANNAHVEGSEHKVNGYNASCIHIEGIGHIVNEGGMYCHIEGYHNDGSNSYATHISGSNNTVDGSWTTVYGTYNTVIANKSFVVGDDNNIVGDTYYHSYINALGYNLITDANIEHQTIIGKYNMINIDAAFIIGNGSDSARSNAFIVDKSGNVSITGTLTQSSDRRLKEHIAYLNETEKANQFIRSLKPAYFKKDKKEHLGFYAQDIEQIDEWHCMVGEMNGFKTLSYTEIIAPLVTYCQNLEKEITTLKECIKELEEK